MSDQVKRKIGEVIGQYLFHADWVASLTKGIWDVIKDDIVKPQRMPQTSNRFFHLLKYAENGKYKEFCEELGKIEYQWLTEEQKRHFHRVILLAMGHFKK